MTNDTDGRGRASEAVRGTTDAIQRLLDVAVDQRPTVTVEQPVGLGAVVRSDDGEPWTKWNDWLWRSRYAPYRDCEWGAFSAVEVVSPGVEGL